MHIYLSNLMKDYRIRILITVALNIFNKNEFNGSYQYRI